MTQRVPKRNILITGAGGGLGCGWAFTSAGHGHTILVTDLDAAAAKETTARSGGRPVGIAEFARPGRDVGAGRRAFHQPPGWLGPSKC